MGWLIVNQVFKQLQGSASVGEISFALTAGQRLGIAGETGAGKSSLLKIIAGLLQPDSGQVVFEGERVLGPEERLLPGHAAIAYLSQHFELINHYRVEEYLALTSLLTTSEAKRLYALCGIDALLKRKTTQLSGGERQRVALAAALGKKPRLLLLDEPFSNLDTGQKEKIKEVLIGIEKEAVLTPLIVSHDASDLLSWADTILLVQHGKVVQQGSPRSLYIDPVNAYCAGLLGPYTPVPIDWLTPLTPRTVNSDSTLIYLRPEHLEIELQQPQRAAAPATVTEVHFMGSHFLVQLWCNGQLVRASTRLNSLEKGQEVFIFIRDWPW